MEETKRKESVFGREVRCKGETEEEEKEVLAACESG